MSINTFNLKFFLLLLFFSLSGDNLFAQPISEETKPLTGKVFIDKNVDCLEDVADFPLANWIVSAKGTKTYYQLTDKNGAYRFDLPVDTYEVTVTIPEDGVSSPHWASCQLATTVVVSEEISSLEVIDFPIISIFSCTQLTIESGIPFLNSCSEQFYTFTYHNSGDSFVEEAYAIITFDPEIVILDGTVPGIELGNNSFRYNIGEVEINETSTFKVKVKVDCNLPLDGKTYCVDAHIFPGDECTPSNSPSIKPVFTVESFCEEESVVFRISNVGINVTNASSLIVIEDMVMRIQGQPFQVPTGGVEEIRLPANGATYQIRINQPNSNIAITNFIEGCGTNENGKISTGIVNMYTQRYPSIGKVRDCRENMATMDTKIAFPKGYDTNNYIEQNTPINYHIRFENEEENTLEKIIISDTLSAHLDMNTFKPLGSSHPYELEVLTLGSTDEEKIVLKFTFSDINLPSNSIDESSANGFVLFSIQPKANLPEGTQIFNQATIVKDTTVTRTNTTRHQIDKDFIRINLITNIKEIATEQVIIAPNPFSNYTNLSLKGRTIQKGRFILYDAFGRQLETLPFNGNELFYENNNLNSGWYYFKIYEKDQLLATGKLIVTL